MVTYNSSKYVLEAIESVLNSNFCDFELLILDDCSSDGTWDIIRSFSDRRIVAYRNERNIGEYANRNKCLELAQGEYVIYIDGDDCIHPHALGRFWDVVQVFPNCGMVISRPQDDRFIYPVCLTPAELYRMHYFTDTVLNLALVRVLFHREKFISVGGFSPFYKSGDDFARLQMAQHFPVVLIEDGLVWWRRSSGQASERLFQSYLGAIEPFEIKIHFLFSATTPLSAKEVKKAKRILRLKMFQTFKSLIRRRKFGWAIQFTKDALSLFQNCEVIGGNREVLGRHRL